MAAILRPFSNPSKQPEPTLTGLSGVQCATLCTFRGVARSYTPGAASSSKHLQNGEEIYAQPARFGEKCGDCHGPVRVAECVCSVPGTRGLCRTRGSRGSARRASRELRGSPLCRCGLDRWVLGLGRWPAHLARRLLGPRSSGLLLAPARLGAGPRRLADASRRLGPSLI